MENVLEVKNLTKKFNDFTAVNNISFNLKDGEILGLLGPNGAGKTTTMQMLLGILTPTDGSIVYFGKDFKKHREEILEQVNFSSTYTNLPWILTVKENLTFMSYLYQIPNRASRVNKLVEIFKLEELLHKQMSALSAGQITRVNLAKSFLNFPKVLLLDEPTASLDPDVATYIREFLEKERKEFQVSIVITSHNMSEVELLCDRVIFINRGKIVADDTPNNLAKSIKVSHVVLRMEKIEAAQKYCNTQKISYTIAGKYITIDINEQQIPQFLRDLSQHNIHYDEISIEKPTLEDYFLQVVSKK